MRLGAAKDRALLAELLVHAGEMVSTDHLADRLWGTSQRADPINAVQVRVSRLRRQLRSVAGPAGAALVQTRPGGYELTVTHARTDAAAYEAALESAAEAGTSEAYDRAEALWRGEPFAGVPMTVCLAAEFARLEELRAGAAEARASAALAAGRPAEVVATITAFLERHPLRERSHELLITALRDLGRTPEALAAYGRLQAILADELGTGPSGALRALHLELLRAEEEDEATSGLPTPSPPCPAQLPPAPTLLLGRALEVAEIGEKLEANAFASASPVVVISGMGGVGKTALAVSAAHRWAPRYPDGQLFLRLHGSTSGLDPQDPMELVDAVVRSLGVTPPVHRDADEAGAFLRSLLAQRRVLLVLDDARSAAQVRTLLPNNSGCAVIVTSRMRLAAIDDASHVALGPLTRHACLAVLDAVAGAGTVAAEPAASARLAELCGGLPLALRITAARLAGRPSWSVSSIAERLASANQRLDELELDDLSVRATLAVTYRGLARSGGSLRERAAARAFCCLGMLDLPQFSVPVMARLMDATEREARMALDLLVDVALLHEVSLGYYTPHDLVRDYAREIARGQNALTQAGGAIERALEWYAAMVGRSAMALLAEGPERRRRVPYSCDDAPTVADEREALAWCDEELINLMAIANHHAQAPLDHIHFLRLVPALFPYLQRRGRTLELQRFNDIALAVARSTHNGTAEAQALSDLAASHFMCGRFEGALSCNEEAAQLIRRLGDTAWERKALGNTGMLLQLLGRNTEAVAVLERILTLAREEGDARDEAICLSHLGNLHESDNTHLAMELHRRSLDIGIWHDDPVLQQAAHCNVGYAHLSLNQPEAALLHFDAGMRLLGSAGNGDWHMESQTRLGLVRGLHRLDRNGPAEQRCKELMDLARNRGDTYTEGLAHWEYGNILAASQRPSEAFTHWKQAWDALGRTEVKGLEDLEALIAGNQL
ncbi:SARP family transcriptional regulator [Streptomyces lucensis JCM 4490]|uniref:SARP family transcriptional regulator n=1 Tax=Streptomyces lucensis JCM 4490 TaxID=1306176 RepID=A0A918J939_9ACTN|nr:SARP family transcriptional regulator [Streptomyces lucensis JCM 4490]